MRVAVLHPTLNGMGGSEQVCLNIIESLKERKHEVVLGTFEWTNWKKARGCFGKVVKPDKEIVRGRVLPRFSYGETLNLSSLASKMPKECDVYIVSCTSPWFYCPPAKKSIVYMLPPLGYQKGLSRLYLRSYAFVQKLLLNRVGHRILLTNSIFSAETIKRVYSFEPHVLYPPVDLRRFCPSEKEDLVVSVGRFDPLKRHEILIRAFKHVKNHAKCIIIGSSAGDILSSSQRYLLALKKLVRKLGISDKVTFLVNCPSDMLIETLSRAKIYADCFYGEPFGISIVEGMASGCVPIVHKSGGAYCDILRYGLYGFGFEDEKELAGSLNCLLTDKNLWKSYSEKAVVRSECFSKENFKRGFAEFVESQTAHNSP